MKKIRNKENLMPNNKEKKKEKTKKKDVIIVTLRAVFDIGPDLSKSSAVIPHSRWGQKPTPSNLRLAAALRCSMKQLLRSARAAC